MDNKKIAFLPKEICVAVGRTIELYNNQVCLTADKYHFQWKCAVGKAMGRKFSITATKEMLGEDASSSEAQYPLTLNLYNDDLELCASLSTVLKIVKDTVRKTKILPIGDSLTNNKPWLAEVIALSDGRIKFLGTRGSLEISHEGRSGFSAYGYIHDTKYTFERNYHGAPSVDSEINPFWDGKKFSLAHYIDVQGEYIGGRPSAVSIYLGTNGMNIDPTVNAGSIKTIVDTIKEEYPDLPIFVCNTIFRGPQDGYGNAAGFKYEEDTKVFRLMVRLHEIFDDYENVHLIPVALCHDTQYNFGNIETPVNPRAEQTESLPKEAVHPQKQGYLQMADIIFSTYAAYLPETEK